MGIDDQTPLLYALNKSNTPFISSEGTVNRSQIGCVFEQTVVGPENHLLFGGQSLICYWGNDREIGSVIKFGFPQYKDWTEKYYQHSLFNQLIREFAVSRYVNQFIPQTGVEVHKFDVITIS